MWGKWLESVAVHFGDPSHSSLTKHLKIRKFSFKFIEYKKLIRVQILQNTLGIASLRKACSQAQNKFERLTKDQLHERLPQKSKVRQFADFRQTFCSIRHQRSALEQLKCKSARVKSSSGKIWPVKFLYKKNDF